jgi:hypothetical protein
MKVIRIQMYEVMVAHLVRIFLSEKSRFLNVYIT